jgi:hypothetical protein
MSWENDDFTLKRLFLRVNFQRNSLLLIFFLIFSLTSSAQILNDSAQNVYGPKTTRYFLEEDVFNSIDTLYYIDTVLNAFHRYTYPQKFNYKYSDLGNKGTAIQPLFYKSPSNIGFRSGFNAYDLYYEDLVDMKFYDTKSPYSKFYYVQGGRGTSFLETELSRNITPNWNLGITFNRIAANPQIEYEARPSNPEADHYSYSAYTAYKTENGKYFIDVYFRRMHHQVRESGGVNITDAFLDNGKVSSSRFFESYDNHIKELASAISGDLRANFHIYHQYKISNLVGLYHIFDFESQRIRYGDESAGEYRPEFYGTNLLDNTATSTETTYFKIYRNDIGLKGEIDKFKYRFYYRRRSFFVDNMRLPDVDWQNEDITGGEFAMRFSERSVMHINAEILGNSSFMGEGSSNYQKKRDYKLDFTFDNKYLKLKFTGGQYNPSYLQQIYYSNNHSWDNVSKFSPTISYDLSLSTSIPLGPFTINPNAKFSQVDNYIYYKRETTVTGGTQVAPDQKKGVFSIFSPGVDMRLKFWSIVLKNSYTLNIHEDDTSKSVFRLPKMQDNLLLYYERTISKRQHVLQAGFDATWTLGYYADRYMPSIQQFYIQNEYKQQPYFVVDVFAAMKINRTRVFAKYSNLTRITGGGYFVRPYYYGYQSVLDVGVNWMFFD